MVNTEVKTNMPIHENGRDLVNMLFVQLFYIKSAMLLLPK